MELDEVLELIMNGELSIRMASQKYGYGRDFLKSQLVKKYEGNPKALQKIDEIMKLNKRNSTILNLDENLLEKVLFEVIDKKITMKEAQEILHIKDKETLRNKFAEYVYQTDNRELAKRYRDYMEEKKVDQSGTNYRLVAIYMIQNNYTQTDIAHMLDVHPRTVSREFEKLKQDEDKRLYDLIKAYSDKKMRGKKFNSYEIALQNLILESYENAHPELLYESVKSKTQEKAEKEDYIVMKEEKLRKQGLTQVQIAEQLKVSVSAIRRAKMSKRQRDVIEEHVR